MKACLTYAPMIGSRPGELSPEDTRALAAHIAECPSCAGLAAEAAAAEGLLTEGLLAQANSRDFGPFVEQVMTRVSAGPVRGAARRGVEGRPTPWRAALASLRNHWRLATAALVAVVAALSVFMYVERDVSEPEQLASLEVDLQGGSTVLQTSDGPVVLFESDDDSGS